MLAYRLNIAAFTLASGAIVAPIRYVSVVWAAVLGYAIWDDVPDARVILGAAIIVAAGLYIWRREAALKSGGRNTAQYSKGSRPTGSTRSSSRP